MRRIAQIFRILRILRYLIGANGQKYISDKVLIKKYPNMDITDHILESQT